MCSRTTGGGYSGSSTLAMLEGWTDILSEYERPRRWPVLSIMLSGGDTETCCERERSEGSSWSASAGREVGASRAGLVRILVSALAADSRGSTAAGGRW